MYNPEENQGRSERQTQYAEAVAAASGLILSLYLLAQLVNYIF